MRRIKLMKNSILVRMFGFPATLIHGDTLVLDRWLWLKKYLPKTNNNERLIDIGCGSGSFVTGAALRGYESLGLSWDEINHKKGIDRAKTCGAKLASFSVADVRHLDTYEDLKDFDVIVNTENIEHIIDDKKLFQDMYAVLKPGGYILLTTPYLYYQAISESDKGPFIREENGGHVRRGYSKKMLEELCEISGFKVEALSFVSGILSQKICSMQRIIGKKYPLLGWIFILPFRMIPPILDKYITKIFNKPFYSICLVAYKPRFN